MSMYLHLFLLSKKSSVVVLAEWLNLLVTHYHVLHSCFPLLILFLKYDFHTSFIKQIK
ncbi:hypothetical protein Bca101_022608 [Brassica carinata]